MNVTVLSVRRPVTGVMVFLALTILGLFTFSRLKLDMLPELDFPIVAIIAQYPGAGPDSIEQLVTRPIEDAMSSVQNVEDVNSTSNQGSSVILVKFAWGTNMDQAEQDVRRNLEIYANDRLPDDVPQPLTFAFDPSLQPVVFMTVNAPGTPEAVRTLAEDVVEPYLARIPGVAAAEVIGGTKREIQVRLLPEWLEAYKIAPSQVLAALRGANVMIPGGQLRQSKQELSISTDAEFTGIQQIKDVVVGYAGQVPIELQQVAEVVDGFEEQTAVVRANDAPAVMLAVRKQSDANTVQVSRRVIKELSKIEQLLPEGATITPVFDQGEPITRSIANLGDSAFLAVVLTALVLLAFLRSWRTASIVLVSIPLSLLATFAVMDFLGVTLNTISMAGLALAVGMLVDNSIVVLENIFKHHQGGEPIKEAAIKGTLEMAMPITASTLTTVAVFAPVLFVPGLAGQLFRDMSITICVSLVCSLLIAITLVPLMASLLIKSLGMNRFERVLGMLTGWLDPLSERYGRALALVLRHRKKSIGAALLVFVICMVAGSTVGADFLPKNDQGQVQFEVKAAPGTSLWTTDAIFREVEKVVREKVPEAVVTVSQFGGDSEGFGALFGQNSYTGSVQVRLTPMSERKRSQFDIEDVLREHFKDFPGVEIRPQQHGLPGQEGDIAVKIFADELNVLREYGARLKNKLETVEGATDVVFSMEQGRPELVVEVDRVQARLLGLSAAEVASTVSTYFLGTVATTYREAGEEYDIRVQAPELVREDITRLRRLPVVTPNGTVVPLETVASIRQALGPTAITRENQRRVATITLAAQRTSLGELIGRINNAITEVGHTPGVTTLVGGTAEDMQESFMALGLSLLVAVLLVYMVMASQFESLLEPFVILFAIPLAMAGVMLALAITQTSLQVTALIGIILLSGVVVNNGIVLIDVLKTRRHEGMELTRAAVEAGRSRLRPILMTTLTTVFGMIPLALEIGDGSETWAPMARAVIGGLSLSTVLTLVVVPVLYVSLAGWVDRRRAGKRERAGRDSEPLGVAAAQR